MKLKLLPIIIVTMVFLSPTSLKAATIDDLQAEIRQLREQVRRMQSSLLSLVANSTVRQNGAASNGESISPQAPSYGATLPIY
jgi:hypothetical protein